MNDTLHNLLLSCDVEGAWEHPPGANWQSAIAEVKLLRPQLEAALGADLSLDDGVQDASFFADLGLLVKQPTSDETISWAYELGFRFSWFGRLYTVRGDSWQERLNETAQSILSQSGFIYVPVDALAALYDGVNHPPEPGFTWWMRYFEYV